MGLEHAPARGHPFEQEVVAAGVEGDVDEPAARGRVPRAPVEARGDVALGDDRGYAGGDGRGRHDRIDDAAAERVADVEVPEWIRSAGLVGSAIECVREVAAAGFSQRYWL